MTGPEHYWLAGHQLAAAKRPVGDPGGPFVAAQIHALLSVAAALVLTGPRSRMPTTTPMAQAETTGADFADLSAEGR